MAYVEWDETYLVGIQLLDYQHQRLFGIVNDMYKEVTACQTLADEAMLTGRFIKRFQAYAQIHFEAEERILAENKYPAFPQHQAEHEDIVKKLERLGNKHASGELAVSFDVFKLACDWIANHIKDSDQKYIAYLKP